MNQPQKDKKNQYFVKSVAIDSPAWQTFMDSKFIQSPATLASYKTNIGKLDRYLKSANRTIDSVIVDMKTNTLNRYDVLNGLVRFLYTEEHASNLTIIKAVKACRFFFAFHEVDFNKERFNARVTLPPKGRHDKEPLDKADIRRIVLAITDTSLRTYIIVLATTGMRASEALSIRQCDLKLDGEDPPYIIIRGEFTKTKADRIVYLTKEAALAIRVYLAWKHRFRFGHYKNPQTMKIEYVRFTPQVVPTDLLFAPYHRVSLPGRNRNPKIKTLYVDYGKKFNAVLDAINMAERETYANRRKITRHSFRRYVKSLIADMGYSDFSEWFIGHIGSEYYKKKPVEKATLFKKIEPAMSIVDTELVEASMKDQAAQMEVLKTSIMQEKATNNSLQKSYQDLSGKYEELRQMILDNSMEKGKKALAATTS